ncbi:MAG: Asp-tRNA(Asn)/Glu-tRNA(Gln) amidotransferase subunit GatA [Candidatus Ranarchaeia archaeon]
MEILDLSLIELVQRLSERSIDPSTVLDAYFQRVKRLDPKIKAFIDIEYDRLVSQLGHLGSIGTDKKLQGAPIAIKDNICVKDVYATCGSRILRSFRSPYDATVVQKLRSAGAILFGKTNMDEFGMGSSTENSAFFPTRNPWNLEYVPGGSSGGSAAAVSSIQVPAALGSDTGGSIRCPASYCGVTGLKPTYGLVSRYGLIAYACSLEQIGPITRSAEDCRLLFQVILGEDPLDPTTRPIPEKMRDNMASASSPLKIALPQAFLSEGTAPHVQKAVLDASERLTELGHIVEETSLPYLDAALPAYYIIAMSEASSNLARFDGVRYGPADPEVAGNPNPIYREHIERYRRKYFGDEVKRRILIGSHTLSAGYYNQYYMKALKVRRLITNAFHTVFKDFDAVIGPTMPDVAFRLNERVTDPIAMYLTDIFTVPVNLAGLPALSIPCGFHQGLPIGLQIIGPSFSDFKLLTLAEQFQGITSYHRQRPPL